MIKLVDNNYFFTGYYDFEQDRDTFAEVADPSFFKNRNNFSKYLKIVRGKLVVAFGF